MDFEGFIVGIVLVNKGGSQVSPKPCGERWSFTVSCSLEYKGGGIKLSRFFRIPG